MVSFHLLHEDRYTRVKSNIMAGLRWICILLLLLPTSSDLHSVNSISRVSQKEAILSRQQRQVSSHMTPSYSHTDGVSRGESSVTRGESSVTRYEPSVTHLLKTSTSSSIEAKVQPTPSEDITKYHTSTQAPASSRLTISIQLASSSVTQASRETSLHTRVTVSTEGVVSTPVLSPSSLTPITQDSVTIANKDGVTLSTRHLSVTTTLAASSSVTPVTHSVTPSDITPTSSFIGVPVASTYVTQPSVTESPSHTTFVTPSLHDVTTSRATPVTISSVTESPSRTPFVTPSSHGVTTPRVTSSPAASASAHDVTTKRVMPVTTTVMVTPSQIPVTSAPPTQTPPHVPYIKVEVGWKRITVGMDVELRCTSNVRPSPELTWRRNGKVLTSNHTQNVSVLLRNVSRKEGGAYTCQAYTTGIRTLIKNRTILLRVYLSVMPTYPAPEQINKTDTTITIPLHCIPYLSDGKKVQFVQLVVSITTETSFNRLPAPDNYTEDRLRERTSPYIAAMIPTGEGWVDSVDLGNGVYYSHLTARRIRRSPNSYYNAPLLPNTYYTVFQRLVAGDGEYETPSPWMPPVRTLAASATDMPTTRVESSNIPLILGLLAGILVVVLVALVAGRYYLVRRNHPVTELEERYEMTSPGGKNRLERIARTFTLAGMKAHYRQSGPIHISEFEDHVTRMRRSGDLFYSTEYERIPAPDHVTATHSLDPVNHWKNRYINIVAYDHSRVKLQAYDDEPGSDYINANFLPGYRRDRAYIAAQGPLPDTCRDFWRMIWEQNSRTVVMLTNLKERGRDKCTQYWPSQGCVTWEDISVTLDGVTELTPYAVRTLRVARAGCEEVREIKQFHFTSWPDHGVPGSVCFLLAFVRMATRADPPGAGPMTVHCSAGVGRTGTFIVIDAMLQQIKEEKTVDVLGLVTSLRRDRNLMVQTEQQYIFTHDALLDAIISGETETSVGELRSHMRSLQLEDSQTGLTPMFSEFQKLSRCVNPALTITSATLSVNKHKNRYANVLPYDSSRVHLTMHAGVEGSDYINANYIDGYMAKKTFIATQAPIPDTIPDFWRMIWEQDCCTIVTLAQEVEQAKAKMHRYWPTKQPITFGSLVVEMQDKHKTDHIVVRVFKLTHAEESASRVVRQFHYTAWTEETLLDTGCQLLDLIGRVESWQTGTGNKVIVVHCSAGVGRTGVFCAVSILIDRLKAEAMVDVFQTVKQLREQRPAMVQTKGQYQFCYEVLLEYLASFEPLESCSRIPGFSSLPDHPYPVSTPPLVEPTPAPRQKKRLPSPDSDVYEETVLLKSDDSPANHNIDFKINNSPPVSPVHSVERETVLESSGSGPGLADQDELSGGESSDYEYTPVFSDKKTTKK